MRYILRALNIRWSNRWTRSQTKSLIVQAKQAKKLPDFRIDNKSLAAINAAPNGAICGSQESSGTTPDAPKETEMGDPFFGLQVEIDARVEAAITEVAVGAGPVPVTV